MINIVRVTLFATILASLAGSISADEIRRFEDRLGQDTCFFASAHNVADLKDRLAKCSMGRLLGDASLADARRQLLQLIQDGIKESDLPQNITLDDFLKIPTGEAAFAILKPSGEKVPFIASLDFGDSKKTVDQLIAQLATIKGDERRYEKTKHANVELHIIHNDKGGEQSNPASVVCVIGSTVVMTNSIDVAKKQIDRWNTDNPKSLANYKPFQSIQNQSKFEGQLPSVFWYTDFNMLINGLMEGKNDAPTMMIRMNLPKLGLDKLRAIGGGLEFSTTKYDMISRTIGFVDQPTNGLLSMLKLSETALELPKWVPRGVEAVGSLNWDLENAYTSCRELTDSLVGKGSFDKAIVHMANDQAGPRIHIKLDVVDQLTGEVSIVQSPAALVNGELEEGPTLLAAKVQEVEQAKQLLARLLTNNKAFRAREFSGSRIFTSNDADLGISLTIAHGCLMVSDGAKLLEQTITLENEAAGLLGQKSMQRVLKELPRRSAFVALQEPGQQLSVIYEYFRTIASADLKFQKLGKLPDFQQLRHYLLPSASYLVPTETGFMHTGFSLQPANGGE
jgi:hypothetical protein